MTQASRRSDKVALPPGTLVHVGRRRTERARVTILDYDQDGLREVADPTLEQMVQYAASPSVTWFHVEGLHEVDLVARLGEVFNLHPLVQEDIVNTNQRPKLEDYGDYLYIVAKALLRDEGQGEYALEQISIILGPRWVISFQEGGADLFETVGMRIKGGKGRIRRLGPDYLAYSLIDAVVDSFFVVLEDLGDRIERLEEELLGQPTPQTIKPLHRLKRLSLTLRKAAWPLREVIGALERQDEGMVRQDTRVYLRDVYDHTVQIMDAADTSRDMLSGMLDLYLSSVSNRMNEVMKVLTIIATLFIPLTFLAGLYGMNFEYMPELKWRFGYPAVLLAMAAVVAGMLVYFRRKKWF